MRNFLTVTRLLRAIGFEPKTVLDVGACYGTPAITDVFPEAYHHWFEPVAEVAATLSRYSPRVAGEVHVMALGDTDTTMDLFVPAASVDSARLLLGSEALSAPAQADTRQVPVKRLDSVLAGCAPARPILLKTDCQGFDLAVLRGATASLPMIDVAVIEVHMFPAYPGAPDNTFDSVYALMRAAGFSLFDIADPLSRPKDGVIAQLDVFFINDRGVFPRPIGWV